MTLYINESLGNLDLSVSNIIRDKGINTCYQHYSPNQKAACLGCIISINNEQNTIIEQTLRKCLEDMDEKINAVNFCILKKRDVKIRNLCIDIGSIPLTIDDFSLMNDSDWFLGDFENLERKYERNDLKHDPLYKYLYIKKIKKVLQKYMKR